MSVIASRAPGLIATLLSLVLLTGCESTYYNTMEKFGVHKRDILVDRIEEARESQQEGQQQFKDALEQFRSVVAFDGGDLEKQYNRLNAAYEDSEAAAEDIADRIDSVEDVAEDLFDEWQAELKQYTNQNLRRDSEAKLRSTRRNYQQLISAMRSAERSIEPVLNTLRDNTLYLKHNLNAAAIGSLRNELGSVDSQVRQLIAAMEKSIAESDAFIQTLTSP